MMTLRLRTICSHIPRCRVFADVGCDHGYCTHFVLNEGLCERAYVSDVSDACLDKARVLLADEIAAGRCIPVCTDGLENFPEWPDCVLIAGMGGEEIVRILSKGPLPAAFVLQPMKNTEKVRRFLVGRGCTISLDMTFADGKFYDLIVGTGEGGTSYSDWEYKFGRDNLKSPGPDFLKMVEGEQHKLRARLNRPGMKPETREALRAQLYELEVITDAASGDL